MNEIDELNRLMERKRMLTARESADPGLARRLRALRVWQAARLARTYQDMRSEPRYGPALDFFLSDLYGPQDFTRRDRDIERAWERLRRTLPDAVLSVLGESLELQALTAELDHTMVGELRSHEVTAKSYADAYRAVGRPGERRRQIELIIDIGTALERAVRHRLTGLALVAARVPAYAMGFGALQSFLERGYTAFRDMGGALALLDTIQQRETRLMEALLRGDSDPFGCNATSEAARG